MEFEGHSDRRDPHWFQYLLQYLWNGEFPMVLPRLLLKNIKLLARSYIVKNDKLIKKITRNQQLYYAAYIPFVDRASLIRKYHLVLGQMQVNTM